jgi:sensor histidine kinase YesM
MSFIFSTALELFVLFLFGWLIMKCRPLLSGITAILAITIMQIINGLFQSLTHIVVSWAFPLGCFGDLILGALALGSVISVFFAYRYTFKSFYSRKMALTQQVLVLLLPTFFILLILQFIISSTGSQSFLFDKTSPFLPQFHDVGLLLLQLAALGCLVTVLYAYNRLLSGFELEMKNTMLEQQAASQQDYIHELKGRYEQTRSFRHDIKNHWTVLQSLIKKGDLSKAEEYLGKLKDITDKLSFPCHTGNTVINMLLSNKLGLAVQKGIHVDCTVKIPSGIPIDDLDLCIVFSNAVDNAINACGTVAEREKYILLSAMQKGDFFMIEVENSRLIKDNTTVVFGIGLNNIKAVAEKYNGTISIENGTDFFQLNVLFLIPQHQTYH